MGQGQGSDQLPAPPRGVVSGHAPHPARSRPRGQSTTGARAAPLPASLAPTSPHVVCGTASARRC